MTRDEFELRLIEKIKEPWFHIDELADALQVPRQRPTDADLHTEPELIESVVHYLVDVEELLDGDDADDELTLTIGLFVYGYVRETLA